MSRLEEWVSNTIRTIEGTSVARLFRLKGPDQSTWGTWPADTPELGATIQACMLMLGEELPKGRHQVQVWAYDENGNELAMLPQAVHGRSDAAATAAAEQLTLQKATSAAIANATAMNEGLRRQIEVLNKAITETTESNVELLDTVQTLVAETAQREMAEARRNMVNQTLGVVCEAVQQYAKPLLALLVGKMDGPTAQAMVKAVSTQPPQPPKPPVPKVESSSHPVLEASQEDHAEPRQQPSDSADLHSNRKPKSAEAPDGTRPQAKRGFTSPRARKGSGRGREPVRKPVRRSARNP
jgi:hypothetical protein